MFLGSVIGDKSMVAAGAVLPPGTEIPTGQLWGGNPAAFMRNLSAADIAGLGEVCVVKLRVEKNVFQWCMRLFSIFRVYIIFYYQPSLFLVVIIYMSARGVVTHCLE